MLMRTVIHFLVVFAALCTQSQAVQTSCTPGELRTDSTPTCISIERDVTGDSDHDATCGVQYREKRAADWNEVLALFRVDYKWWYHTEKAKQPFNIFAGSIMFLEPGTKYEVRLDLTDPDGGKVTKTVTIATRPIPELPKGGRTLHVAPGSGGGSDSADDPFRGLAAVQEAAKPGDICLLHEGKYGSFTFEESGEPGKYIAWKAAGDGNVVFTWLRVQASHIWLEDLKLKREEKSPGLRAGSKTTDVVIRRNQFNGFHYSILLSRDSRY